MIMIVIAEHVRLVSSLDWDVILVLCTWAPSARGERAFRGSVRKRLMHYLVGQAKLTRGRRRISTNTLCGHVSHNITPVSNGHSDSHCPESVGVKPVSQ